MLTVALSSFRGYRDHESSPPSCRPVSSSRGDRRACSRSQFPRSFCRFSSRWRSLCRPPPLFRSRPRWRQIDRRPGLGQVGRQSQRQEEGGQELGRQDRQVARARTSPNRTGCFTATRRVGPSIRSWPSSISRFARAGRTTRRSASPIADDEEWLRRVYLDLVGHIPSWNEIERFHKDKNPAKRAALVDKLLDDPATSAIGRRSGRT